MVGTLLNEGRLGRPWSDLFAPLELGLSRLADGFRSPAAVWEEGSQLHFQFDLPGVAHDDVDVTVHEGRLTVRAERKPLEEEREWLLNELPVGTLQRAFRLPDDVDEGSVEADLKDGVLHIAIGRKPEVQPKRIEVKTG